MTMDLAIQSCWEIMRRWDMNWRALESHIFLFMIQCLKLYFIPLFQISLI